MQRKKREKIQRIDTKKRKSFFKKKCQKFQPISDPGQTTSDRSKFPSWDRSAVVFIEYLETSSGIVILERVVRFEEMTSLHEWCMTHATKFTQQYRVLRNQHKTMSIWRNMTMRCIIIYLESTGNADRLQRAPNSRCFRVPPSARSI